MINLESLNGLFTIHHLCQEDIQLLSDFKVKKKEGYGLQYYLQNIAYRDELDGIARTYLIKDGDCIVAYFTLRTGLLTVSRGLFKGFDTYTGIELANFAVNDDYREGHDDIPKLGSYIFAKFILPLIKEISLYVGAKILYIYALPHNKLMSHYEKMGFKTVSGKPEKFIYSHVKPAYDKGCRLMCQLI